MSLRTALLKTADKVRAIASKPSIDERTTSVTIRRRVTSGGQLGRVGDGGGVSSTDLVLSPRPKVREVSQREITGSGGRYQAGDVKVGPITPTYSAGGYTEEQLAPRVTTNGVEIRYVLAGGITGEYSRIDLSTDRSHSWFLVLRRTRSTP